MIWVESRICSVHVVDDRAHATHDSGKTHDSQQEVSYHEEVLFLPGWQWCVPHSSQDQGGEIKAVQILAPQALKARLCWVWVYPGVLPKAQVLGQGKIEAAIPVDDDKDVEHQFSDSKGIGVSCASLCAVKGLKEAGHPKKAIQPQCGYMGAQPHVDQIGGDQRSQVQYKAPRANITTGNHTLVYHQDALF